VQGPRIMCSILLRAPLMLVLSLIGVQAPARRRFQVQGDRAGHVQGLAKAEPATATKECVLPALQARCHLQVPPQKAVPSVGRREAGPPGRHLFEPNPTPNSNNFQPNESCTTIDAPKSLPSCGRRLEVPTLEVEASLSHLRPIGPPTSAPAAAASAAADTTTDSGRIPGDITARPALPLEQACPSTNGHATRASAELTWPSQLEGRPPSHPSMPPRFVEQTPRSSTSALRTMLGTDTAAAENLTATVAMSGRRDSTALASQASSDGHTNPSLQLPGSLASTPVAFGTGTHFTASIASRNGDSASRVGLVSSAASIRDDLAAGLASKSSSAVSNLSTAAVPSATYLATEAEAGGPPTAMTDDGRARVGSFASVGSGEANLNASVVSSSSAVSGPEAGESAMSALLVACSPALSPESSMPDLREASSGSTSMATLPQHLQRASQQCTSGREASLLANESWMQPQDVRIAASSVPAAELATGAAEEAADSLAVEEVSFSLRGISAAPSARQSPARVPVNTTLTFALNTAPVDTGEVLHESMDSREMQSRPPSGGRPPSPRSWSETVATTTVDGLRGEDFDLLGPLLARPLYPGTAPGTSEAWDHSLNSSVSLIFDSNGNPTACLRNQPQLPRTAFLSTDQTAMLASSTTDHVGLSSLVTSPLAHAEVRRDGTLPWVVKGSAQSNTTSCGGWTSTYRSSDRSSQVCLPLLLLAFCCAGDQVFI
jgi:hypothetical protein